MKTSTKRIILWSGIITVAVLDAFSTALGAVPIIGDLAAIGSNFIWEVIEIGLVFGLVSTKK